MKNHFDVGDLVITQNATFHTELDGALGIVQDGLKSREVLNLRTSQYETHDTYSVQIMGTEIVLAFMPHQLRRLDEGDDSLKAREKTFPLITQNGKVQDQEVSNHGR